MRSAQTLKWLRDFESRNVTFIEEDGSWPIVWDRAKGVAVWDAEGRKYLDLTSAFGVAAAGHANPEVVCAGQRQLARLPHAMGDVHPHELKARLVRELSRITFERWTRGRGPRLKGRVNSGGGGRTGKSILGSSGFEAVEAALKTARLATGKPGVIAFEGAYHGLGFGALNATHRGHFRGPFESQLGRFGHFVPWPGTGSNRRMMRRLLEAQFERHVIGAVLVEPVQGRGGVWISPEWFLPLLREVCDARKALLVADEVFTGFGRTGRWFACEHWGVVPDVICLGKALTGGAPLSACVGKAEVMDAAWPVSDGEAIHTSTFLGHPVGCAMALAQIGELRRRKLPEAAAGLGRWLLGRLNRLKSPAGFAVEARGLGLMCGVELRDAEGGPATREALALVKRMLRRGCLLLPEGEHSNVISIAPPLVVSKTRLEEFLRVFERELAACAADGS